MRFLAAALRMAEAGEQGGAVEHHRRVRGEHQVEKVRRGRHDLDRGAEIGQHAMKRGPFLARFAGERTVVARPARRVHPRIDGVRHREMIRRAHQETGLRLVGHRLHPRFF